MDNVAKHVSSDNWMIKMYCKFTIIRKNFIFANIREFDRSRIQHSHEKFLYIKFT